MDDISIIELEYLRTSIETEDKVFELVSQDQELFETDFGTMLFIVIKYLVDQSITITSGSIAIEIERRGLKEKYFNQFLEFIKTFPRRDHENLLSILMERKALNDRLKLCLDTVQLIKNNKINSDDIDNKFSEMIQGTPEKLTGITIKEISEMSLDDIFSKTSYIKTNIEKLDEIIRGFFNTQLIVIAARPGKGKSSLALQIAENLKDNALYFSLEMNRRELYARILSRYSEVESWKIMAKKLNDDEMKRIMGVHAKISPETKIKVFDKISDVNLIINEIKKSARKGKLKSVFIDYLQLIKGAKGENQNLKIGYITGKLKNLSMELEIPIILLSQLSRGNEKESREPQLSDLRESGNIEQDADVVIFIHEGEFIIAKNRNGKTGKFSIDFEKQFFRFESKYTTIKNEDISYDNKMEYIHN